MTKFKRKQEIKTQKLKVYYYRERDITSIILLVLLNVSLQRCIMAEMNKGKEVMEKFSYSFGLNLLECGDMINATNPMEKDIYNYWDTNYNLTHISTGCLMLCSMAKLELLDKEGNLKRANAEGYVRANGADDATVSKLVRLYEKCRELPMTTTHPCAVALEVSKCFRVGIRDLQWIPDVSFLVNQNQF